MFFSTQKFILIKIISLSFVLSSCAHDRVGKPIEKFFGMYHLVQHHNGFTLGYIDSAPCNRIFIKGDISSAQPLSTGGVNFIDQNGENSFVDLYPQHKKCAENQIFINVLEKNKIEYVVNDVGEIMIANMNQLSNEVRQKLSNEVSSLYANNILGYDGYPVRYNLTTYGQFQEETIVNYYHLKPETDYVGDIGFSFYVATTLGLRLYMAHRNGSIASEYGEFNTVFYGLAKVGNDLFATTGVNSIDVLDAKSLKKKGSIDGMFVSALLPYKDGLLAVAYKYAEDWRKGRLYYIDTLTKQFLMLSNVDIADSRGIAIQDGQIFVSSGADDKLIIFDEKNLSHKNWYGFRYPNGLNLDGEGSLIIADEHAGVIRKVNIKSKKIELEFGFGMLASPTHAVNIKKGIYKGHWLVADADNDRVIIVDPFTNQIKYQLRNIRSPSNIWLEN